MAEPSATSGARIASRQEHAADHRAMKLVAAAKLRRAQERDRSRRARTPTKLDELLAEPRGARSATTAHPLLAQRDAASAAR